MKKKGYAKGGAMKKKGYAKGGAMKKKPVAMSKGSKLKMVEKGGKKVPFFAADGVGKMQAGGALRPRKRPAALVKPKARPGSENKIDKETLVGNMTKAQVEKAISRGKNPSKSNKNFMAGPKSNRSTDKDMAVSKQAAESKKAPVRKKGDRAGVTSKKSKATKKVGKAILKVARLLSPVSGAARAGAAAKKATKKMGGGMMKKKGMAKGGVVKKGAGGSVKKKMPKNLHPNLSNPNAGSGKNRDGIPLSKLGMNASTKRAFRPATKSEIEKIRADERRKQRQKSGQLSQAKKKAKKTAVKAMGGGMMKKKGMAKGGAMKKKGYAKGGVVKKMRGGMMMKKKGYAKGGSVARGSGAARPQRFRRNG